MFEWTDGDCGQVKDIQAINDIVSFTGPKFYVLENIKRFKEKIDCGKLEDQLESRDRQDVVWFRKFDGELSEPVTRLFYEGEYYEWIDNKGVFWPCIDGLNRRELKN
ncbi:uncharacterized protein KRP23_10384 [Phytophthora ramorum]|uniref:uncharacterized protein n=1 Tax=Phytophthora ramorum TaxID=164328 RepID=UPI00309F3E69|nr:hypothetical protein KRP23_10384 [Phytophthora ramorum]